MPKRYNIKKTNQSPNHVSNQKSEPISNTIMSNILTGITFGAGSSIGHRVVDSVVGNRKVEIETPNNSNETTYVPCEKLFEMYSQCLKNESNDCNYLQDIMKLKCNIN